jgi:hypothetical protein
VQLIFSSWNLPFQVSFFSGNIITERCEEVVKMFWRDCEGKEVEPEHEAPAFLLRIMGFGV